MAKKQNNAPEIQLAENNAPEVELTENDAVQPTTPTQPTKETLAIMAVADFMNAVKALKEAYAQLNTVYMAQPINERQLLGAALSKVYTPAEMRLIQNANLAAIIKQM